MFLLGEYYEDEARDIADRLKEVGMKVDIRTFTGQPPGTHTLPGGPDECAQRETGGNGLRKI